MASEQDHDAEIPSIAEEVAPVSAAFAPVDPGPKSDVRHGAIVFILGALNALGPLSIDMYLPAFPMMGEELHVPDGAIEGTLATFLAGLACGQLIYGPLSDRFGRRVPLMIGAIIFILGGIGCALANSLPILVSARLVQALGGAACMVIGRAVVRDLFEEKRAAKVYAHIMLVVGAAPILAPWIGGRILLLGSWRWIFVVLAAFGGLCLLLAALFLPETLPRKRRSAKVTLWGSLRTYGSLLLNSRFVGCLLVTGLVAGMLFSYISGSPSVFIEKYHVTPQQFGYFFGLNSLGLIAGGQLNHWLARRRMPAQILALSLPAGAAVGLALLVVGSTAWGGLPLLAGLLFLCLIAIGISYPNLPAVALAPFGKQAGSASSLFGMAYFALGALGGAAVGWLHDGTALPMTALVAGCSAAAWIVFLALVRRA